MKAGIFALLFAASCMLAACSKPKSSASEFSVFYNGRPNSAVILSPSAPLDVRPILGRNFLLDDFHPDAPSVAVVSHDFWEEAMGQSPQVIGSKIKFRNGEFVVVGVIPAKFNNPIGRTVWISKRD